MPDKEIVYFVLQGNSELFLYTCNDKIQIYNYRNIVNTIPNNRKAVPASYRSVYIQKINWVKSNLMYTGMILYRY